MTEEEAALLCQSIEALIDAKIRAQTGQFTYTKPNEAYMSLKNIVSEIFVELEE